MEVIRKRGEADAMRGVADDQLFTIDKGVSSVAKSSGDIFDENDLKMKKRKKEPRVEKVQNKSEKMFNLWGSSTNAKTKKGLPNTNKNRMKRRDKSVIQSQPKIAAVVTPKSGVSYNPSKELHEDAIAEAAAKELSRYARLESEKMPEVTPYVGDSEEEEEEEEESQSKGDVAANNSSNEDLEQKTKAQIKDKMTRTQRNRQRRAREADLGNIRRKREKALKHEIHMAKTIKKEIEKEEKLREERKQIRDELRKEALENPNKREIYVGGKKRLHEPMTDIALSDELHGSVRSALWLRAANVTCSYHSLNMT